MAHRFGLNFVQRQGTMSNEWKLEHAEDKETAEQLDAQNGNWAKRRSYFFSQSSLLVTFCKNTVGKKYYSMEEPVILKQFISEMIFFNSLCTNQRKKHHTFTK